jgi:dienelactone hydrolase
MKRLLLFTYVCFSFVISAQYQVGHTTITFNDPTRTGGFGSGGGSGRQIQTEIYYPANTAGDNVAVASGQFPVITFGHGFAMSWDAYSNIWGRYAAKGYILAFPRTEGSIPNHGDFGKDLQQVSDKVLALNDNLSSIFFNKIFQKAAIMGHSMGGGASFIAASNNNNIETVIGLAPAETNPSAISAATNTSVPALILSGSADGVTPPADNHVAIFNGLTSTCKNFVSIIGGAHCYFANSNVNCDFGELTSSQNISITRQEQQDKTYAILDPWLDFILKGKCSSYMTFQTAMNGTNGTVNQSTCPSLAPVSITVNNSLLTANSTGTPLSYQWFLNGSPISGEINQTLSVTQNGSYTVEVTYSFGCATSSAYVYTNGTSGIIELKNAVKIYPNPVKSILTIDLSIFGNKKILISDVNGRQILKTSTELNKLDIDCKELKPGYYILTTEINGSNCKTQFIKE